MVEERIEKKVICDTMIWYNIENGIIPIEKLTDIYIATYINIKEFASTNNLITNFNYVKKTIEAFKKYHSFLIIENPIDYLLTLYSSSYQPNNNFAYKLLDTFDNIIGNNLDLTVNDNEKEIFNKWNENKALFPDLINPKLLELRKIRKLNCSKGNYLKCNTIEFTKDFIAEILNGYPNSNICFYKDKFEWDKISFFVQMLDYYFKKIEISGNQIFQDNDLYDLFNMVYVQPDCMYWTMEKKWNNLAKELPVCYNYIYKIKTNLEN